MNLTRVTLDNLFNRALVPNVPTFMDLRIYDIPNTVLSALANLPRNVHVVSVSASLGDSTIDAA